MLGYLGFAIALVGSTIAAYWDLKTTEVPDSISIITAVSGLAVNAGLWYTTGDVMYFVSSVVVGLVFFGLGWLFFLTGVWGGADAFVLGAVGFAFPRLPGVFSPVSVAEWPFALTLLMNVFIVGAVYTLGFALFKGLRSREVMEEYFRDMKDYWKGILAVLIVYCAVIIGITWYLWPGEFLNMSVSYILRSGPFLVGLLMVYRFLRIVEEVGMQKVVAVEDLEEGDVLGEDVEVGDGEEIKADRIVGLSEEQIGDIRENVEKVTVKSGVMFVPAFPVAILLSVTAGDLIFLILA